MRQVKLLDLQAEANLYKNQAREIFDRIFQSGQYIGGTEVEAYEASIAERCHANHAVAISNGTDALTVAMMALKIGPGDEVILPPFTFFATAACVARLGATPVFADILHDTFNINPTAIEAAITKRTKAIIPVHLFGQCADMDTIRNIASANSIPVIEDAAQAIDATYQSRPAGVLGTIACFSCYPTKNLGAVGEGGFITTNDPALDKTCRHIRNQGQTDAYHHEFVGGNFRLNALTCALLSMKLPNLAEMTAKRQRIAAQYDALLTDADVITPPVADGNTHAYHQYTIRSDHRDELRAHLTERGIASGIYYPIPIHLQPCFAHLGGQPGDFPIAEQATREVLSLPIHPMLESDEITYVAESIKEFTSKNETNPRIAIRGT